MKKMTKAMLMTALILGSVQFGTTTVHASELESFTLDEYVVTAARTETKLVDTPANISPYFSAFHQKAFSRPQANKLQADR